MKNPISVLIADNSELIRSTLKLVIAGMEDAVVAGEAANGQEAIDMAKKLSPDVILMDINMSPINGFDATREILKQNPTAKIIGLSLHKKKYYVDKMLSLGARGYISKSVSLDKLVEAIRKVAGGDIFVEGF